MGNSHKNVLLRNHWVNCNQMLVEWYLDDPFQNCVRWSRLPNKMAAKLKIEKMWMKFKKNLLLWNYRANLNQSLLKMILGWSPSKIVSGISDLPPRWPPQQNLILHWTLWEIPIKIFLSEAICSIRTQFWWNSHWMVLFQKCVRGFRPSTKMAPTAELGLAYV